MECQYYVKRRKQCRNSSPFYANSPEEDAIPLLLRSFMALKFLRENSGETAATENSNKAEIDEADIIQQGKTIVSCGPHHFSSLAVSPEHYDPTTTSSAASFGNPAMTIAKHIMTTYAKKGTNKESKENDDEAVCRIWGYAHSYTIDKAIHRTLNAFQKNNFGIINSLHPMPMLSHR